MAAKAQIDDCFESSQQFDYQSVPPSVAKFLRGQAERIRHGYATSIIQIGKALIEAKRHLSHGGFGHWVRSEVGIPARTVQVYMQVAQWAKGKNAAVTQLPPSILYILSAPSTPEEFAVNLLERHDAGEHIDARAARAQLRALRLSKAGSERPKLETAAAGPPAVLIGGDSGNAKAEILLVRVIEILINRLSSSELDEVRNIMTSRPVLEDPDLVRNIEAVFSITSQPNERLRLSYETLQNFNGGRYEAA
jgi:hypothetical protein